MRGIGRRAIIAGSTALVLAAGAGVATAAISSSTGLVTAASPSPGHVDSMVIHGCWTNAERHGSHAFVLLKAGASCPKGTTAVSWNQGPAGRSVLATLSGPARKVTSLDKLNGIRCDGKAGITQLTYRGRGSVTISCAVTRTQPTRTFTGNWHTSPDSGTRTTPCPCGTVTTPCPCGTTSGPPHSPPVTPPSTSPPSTVAPYPDNTSADPVNLGTLVPPTYVSVDPCGTDGHEAIPEMEGYNVAGSQAWYELTVDGFTPPAGCGLGFGVSVLPGNATTGYYGYAATVSGVNPDVPISQAADGPGLPWPTETTTYYIEVIGTGYFSVAA